MRLTCFQCSWIPGPWHDLQSPLWGDPLFGGHRCGHLVQRAWRDAPGLDCCEGLGQEVWVNGWRHVAARFILAEAMARSKDCGPRTGTGKQQIKDFSGRCLQDLCPKAGLCRQTGGCGGSQGCNRSRFRNDPFGRRIDAWEKVGLPIGYGDLWAGYKWCFWAGSSCRDTGGQSLPAMFLPKASKSWVAISWDAN